MRPNSAEYFPLHINDHRADAYEVPPHVRVSGRQFWCGNKKYGLVSTHIGKGWFLHLETIAAKNNVVPAFYRVCESASLYTHAITNIKRLSALNYKANLFLSV